MSTPGSTGGRSEFLSRRVCYVVPPRGRAISTSATAATATAARIAILPRIGAPEDYAQRSQIHAEALCIAALTALWRLRSRVRRRQPPASPTTSASSPAPSPGTTASAAAHNFPGATVPFGMVQWSPDTTPGRQERRRLRLPRQPRRRLQPHPPQRRRLRPLRRLPLPADDRADHLLAGRTGLVGARRQVPARASPMARRAPTPATTRCGSIPVHGSWDRRRADSDDRGPGWAASTLPTEPALERPGSTPAAAPARRSRRGRNRPGGDEISGEASSGLFCGQRPRYKVYFSAVFDRPFGCLRRPGPARPLKLARPRRATARRRPPIPRETAQAGAYASFDTRKNRTVLVRVGVSFVSVADARANLAAESQSAGFGSDRGPGAAALEPGAGAGPGQRRLGPQHEHSTRRSTTRCLRPAPSTTSAASTSAWTARSTTPAMAMISNAYHLGLADGPTEVHKVTLARTLLSQTTPTEGLFPTTHRPAARRRPRWPARRPARSVGRPTNVSDDLLVPVRPGDELDWPALEAHLRLHLDLPAGGMGVRQFARAAPTSPTCSSFGDRSAGVPTPATGGHLWRPGAH